MTDKRKNLDEATLYKWNAQVQSAVAPLARIAYDNSNATKELQKILQDMKVQNDKIYHALFGDEDMKESGLLKQHQEMFDIFQNLKGGKRTTIWVLSGFMFVGSAYLLVKQILK